MKRITNQRTTAGKWAAGLLHRLARDRAGNSFLLIAASLIPIAGVIGGGLDMGRAYVSKSKLQSACDAGALAGRKSMVGNIWSAAALDAADSYFNVNFMIGKYGTTNLTKSFASADGQTVTGQATAKVPTTLMKIFGFNEIDLNVSCQAVLNLPNTDVMFVLDTTGSMLNTNPGDSTNRITSLRSAVQSFHSTIESAKPPGTQARYGFVPYSTTVNVGYLMNSAWMVDNWTYQSRVPDGTDVTFSPSSTTYNWMYRPVQYDVSSLKGLTAGGSITAMVGDDFTSRTVNWRGCIEERDTVRATNYSPIPAGALDMNIDLVPTSGNPASQWRPALPELVYARMDLHDSGAWSITNVRSSNQAVPNVGDYESGNWASCPTTARKLAEMSASDVTSYLGTLNPAGGTYHDIGMIWGARLMSPTGLFASENAATPDGNQITRHLIFMTDGQTDTQPMIYDAYGWPALDRRRVMDASAIPTKADQDDLVEARLDAVCSAVKGKNITLWVIAFGTSLSSNLSNCASSSSNAFEASNTAQLNMAFADIAGKIANLSGGAKGA